MKTFGIFFLPHQDFAPFFVHSNKGPWPMYGSPMSMPSFTLLSQADTFLAWAGVRTEVRIASRGESLRTFHSEQHSSNQTTFLALVTRRPCKAGLAAVMARTSATAENLRLELADHLVRTGLFKRCGIKLDIPGHLVDVHDSLLHKVLTFVMTDVFEQLHVIVRGAWRSSCDQGVQVRPLFRCALAAHWLHRRILCSLKCRSPPRCQ